MKHSILRSGKLYLIVMSSDYLNTQVSLKKNEKCIALYLGYKRFLCKKASIYLMENEIIEEYDV